MAAEGGAALRARAEPPRQSNRRAPAREPPAQHPARPREGRRRARLHSVGRRMVPNPSTQPATFFPERAAALDVRADHNGGRPPVVELRGLTRTYGSEPPVHALRSVDL